MRFARPVPASALVLLAFFLAAAPAARAQTVVTGTYTGADGAPGGGTYNPDDMVYHGDNADNGYTAINSSDTNFVFENVTATGGVGGEVDGTNAANVYRGGDGGNGLLSQGVGSNPNLQVVVNSGTYTGGVGGAAFGTGSRLDGGYGGSGIDVNSSTAIINGGTFTGGDSGPAAGTADGITSEFGGSGLNSNNNAIITVNGGTFHGGNGVQVGVNTGPPGAGIISLSGTTYVYGGTFAGGTGNQDGYGLDFFLGTLTVYGTNFTVTDTEHGTVTPNFNGALPQGEGFITGTLQNDTAPSTFTYRNLNQGGVFSLSDPAAAPEPSQWSAWGVGLLGIGILALKAKKRAAAA